MKMLTEEKLRELLEGAYVRGRVDEQHAQEKYAGGALAIQRAREYLTVHSRVIDPIIAGL